MAQGGCIYLLRAEGTNDFINALFTPARFAFHLFEMLAGVDGKAVGSTFLRPKYKLGYSFRKKYCRHANHIAGNSSLLLNTTGVCDLLHRQNAVG
jgi:hypothetical protein